MKKYLKLLNANILLAIVFVSVIGFMAVKTLPIQGVTNFIKAPFKDAVNDERKSITAYEDTFADKFQYKYKFLNLYGAFAGAIGKQEVNGVFKFDNGNLLNKANTVSKNIELYKNNMLEFCKTNNAFYVQAPAMTNEINPDGSINYHNSEAKELVSHLRSNNVDILDLNQMIDDEGIDRETVFFKTDHHWTSEAAFWGYQRLVQKLNRDYGCNIDSYYTDINNFDKKVYEDWFLGSVGQRTGHVYSGLDDISVIYPKFETTMSAEILQKSRKTIIRKGSYEDTALNYDRIKTKDYYTGDCYLVYLGGNYPHIKIVNSNAPENKKIAIVKDSFASPVAAFLSVCFQEVHVIDVRDLDWMSVNDIIAEIQPDITLAFYSCIPEDRLFKNLT